MAMVQRIEYKGKVEEDNQEAITIISMRDDGDLNEVGGLKVGRKCRILDI